MSAKRPPAKGGRTKRGTVENQSAFQRDAVAGVERRLRREAGHFEQAAQVARLAVELAKVSGGKPESLIEQAWKLIEEARDIVAPALTRREKLKRDYDETWKKFEESGGTEETLIRHWEAKDAMERVAYEDLIAEPGQNGQGETEIWNTRWLDEETGWQAEKPKDTKWKRLTYEAFCKLLKDYAGLIHSNDKERAEKLAAAILDELKREGSLVDWQVWRLLELRQLRRSERSKAGAATLARKKPEDNRAGPVK